ncbi:MAG: hypothetical protein OXU74_06615 [Gemmatimonadota bacterium]|nr:hypothetical protein [Gemmatimonadota bacterium]
MEDRIIHDGTATLAPVPAGRTLKVARTAAECLDMAAAQIERHGLVCREWGERDGPCCTLAAINAAAGLPVSNDTTPAVVGTADDMDRAGFAVPDVVEAEPDGLYVAYAYGARKHAHYAPVFAEYKRRQAVAFSAVGMLYDSLLCRGRLTDDGTIVGSSARRSALMAWSDVHDGKLDGWGAADVVAHLRAAAAFARGCTVHG